jgi:hypothetical protein
VIDVRAGRDRISFSVDRPGTPVLVKSSYFPNWEVQGARGPWRVTPNFMVVVPTGTEVELRYGTTSVEWLGWGVTSAGLVALFLLGRARPVRMPASSRRRSPDEVSEELKTRIDAYLSDLEVGRDPEGGDGGDGREPLDAGASVRPHAG